MLTVMLCDASAYCGIGDGMITERYVVTGLQMTLVESKRQLKLEGSEYTVGKYILS